ncbi:Leucine Rich Repeat [Seminavis robusta]|uniref:Leucine Rich Repeat n=1 Tax=Seminavis robusta TaxID=568900 RepID=A0A9N8ENP8_9STRA|nr:Leucine Rich Repeat [Seminavis robusta]|eukprot:Sro1543_g281110.1 Leucine Rich Repeat (512) ;mRNA; r:6471-8186
MASQKEDSNYKGTLSAPMTMLRGPTGSPSQAPSSVTGGAHHLVSLLPEGTQLALEDTNSPQSQAYYWLMGDRNLPFLTDDRIKQRFTLTAIYFATNGDDWTDNTNWLRYNVHECEWYNQPSFGLKHVLAQLYPDYLIGFHEVTPTICNDDGIYHHLWLDQNHLVGSLPHELYLLTSLQTFSAVFNELEGGISSQIGLLTNLEGMDLAFSFQKAGTIPSEIGMATSLRVLGLVSNGLEGFIPSELWLLTKLQGFLGLSQNPQLEGILPTEIGQFSNLKVLNLEDCGLRGTLPSELGQMDSLEWLFVPRNGINGTIPTELGFLHQNLSVLSLLENNLTGTLPSQLGELTSSTAVSVHNNQLTGTLPREFGQLTSLTMGLTFHNNQLTGTLPTELSSILSLQNLQFQNNRFIGQIPSEFGLLYSLSWLEMANNSLSGIVPQELSALQQSLHTLTLQDNPLLSGSLPDALCQTNGTCTSNILFQCEGSYGLSFDCTDILCGCGCSCGANGANSTE